VEHVISRAQKDNWVASRNSITMKDCPLLALVALAAC
jgi:hypothetical protein